MKWTNAERAKRAEAALLAYIDYCGDSRDANDVETWVADLLTGLRHFADRVGFNFDGDRGALMYEQERDEDPKGRWRSAHKWHVIEDGDV